MAAFVSSRNNAKSNLALRPISGCAPKLGAPTTIDQDT